MVVSSLPGRIRIRHASLRHAGASDRARDLFGVRPGVQSLRHNARVGSLLIEYDPSRVSRAELLALLELSDPGAETQPAVPWRLPQRSLELGIVTSLGVSVGAALVGAHVLHVAAGVAFLGLAGIHIYRAGGLGLLRHRGA